MTNIDGTTLTVDRATAPANSGLTSTEAAAIAENADVTRMSGGVDTAGTTVTLVAALTGLAQNDFIKTAAGEYMKVTNIANNVDLTVERNAAPAGLTQRNQAANAGPGTQVTLAQGGITDDATATTVKLVNEIANLAQNEYIKIGDCSHGAFLWFDDLDEAKALADKLIEFWAESRRRECKDD